MNEMEIVVIIYYHFTWNCRRRSHCHRHRPSCLCRTHSFVRLRAKMSLFSLMCLTFPSTQQRELRNTLSMSDG